MGTFRTDLSEQAEQHVRVERALVCFVHDDGAVVVQIRLAQRLSQQDPICHVFNYRLLRCAVLEADGVTDLQGSALRRYISHIASMFRPSGVFIILENLLIFLLINENCYIN